MKQARLMDCDLSTCRGHNWAHSVLVKKRNLWLPIAAKQITPKLNALKQQHLFTFSHRLSRLRNSACDVVEWFCPELSPGVADTSQVGMKSHESLTGAGGLTPKVAHSYGLGGGTVHLVPLYMNFSWNCLSVPVTL